MREPSRDAQAEDASWMTGLTREPASASDHSRLSAADIASELTGLVLPAKLSMAEKGSRCGCGVRADPDFAPGRWAQEFAVLRGVQRARVGGGLAVACRPRCVSSQGSW